uniref:NADH dehydrogenase subunit 4L n=1 Tax=Amblyomma maculatum TaxID=34609 RepID=UPI001BEEC7CF|nr:NADH dehydrogenase subunit 4L [Amblyomma maculatum]QUB01598.1 NADH dehydrogenase subunit 4L [Amblyomma maculatum]UYB77947.1 NADH dehydrogenase subunit 4L [Amblyomma maculatum]
MMMMSLFLYIIGIFSLIFNRFHLIMILMSIEFMYMTLILIIFYYFIMFNILNIFIFLITIVCEAALGLSLLVLTNNFYGNEMINSFDLIKC